MDGGGRKSESDPAGILGRSDPAGLKLKESDSVATECDNEVKGPSTRRRQSPLTNRPVRTASCSGSRVAIYCHLPSLPISPSLSLSICLCVCMCVYVFRFRFRLNIHRPSSGAGIECHESILLEEGTQEEKS